MNLSHLARRFAVAALLSAQVAAQPAVPDNVALLVNRTTGRVVGPVPAATFAAANNLSGPTGPAATGTVTSFSAGGLAGLFTTNTATPTATPALSFTLTTAAANYVWAGPVSGVAAAPGYRLLVPADLPQIPLSQLATDPLARGNHTGTQAISTIAGLQAALDSAGTTGTTVGTSILNLANPSAISFLRVNADNSSTLLQAAPYKTALGLAAVASSGSAADLTGSFAGNAATATTLQTARTINGVSFNGSANITLPAGAAAAGTLTGNTLAAGVTGSSLTGAAGGSFGSAAYTAAGAYLAAGTTTAGVPDSLNKRYATDAQLTLLGNTSGVNTGDQSSVTGNAGSATVLQTPRAINGVAFDGSAPITVAAAAGTLTGGTLAAGVTGSSLTSAAGGAFGSAAYTASGAYLPAGGNAATASALSPGATINGVTFTGAAPVTVAAAGSTLTGTSLAPGIVSSSLTGAAGGAFGSAAFTASGAYLAAGTTTAGVPDSLNKRYVTDAGLTDLGNTSGVNTGDQTSVTGNAGSATVLQTARAINGVAFDGSAPITVAAAAGTLTGATLAAGVTGSSLTGAAGGAFGSAAYTASGAYLPAGTTTAGVPDSSGKRYVTDAGLTVLGNTSGTNTGDQTTITGNAGSATVLQTARTINGVSFNGSAAITVPAPARSLKLTYTGTPRYLFLPFGAGAALVPSVPVAGQATYTEIAGPALYALNYSESVNFAGSGLLTMSFDDLASVVGTGIAINTVSQITSLSFPALQITSSIAISGLPLLTTLSFAALTYSGNMSIQTLPALTTLSFPALVENGVITIATNNGLTSLSFPVLTYCLGFNPGTLPALTTLSAPNLVTIGSSGLGINTMALLTTLSLPALVTVGSSFNLNTMAALTSLSIPSLTTVTASFGPSFLTVLTTISAPALTNTAGLFPQQNPALTTFSTPATINITGVINFSNGQGNLTSVTFGTIGTLKKVATTTVNLSGQKLPSANVNSVLALMVSLDGTNGTTLFNTGTINLSGGTNGAPTGQGVTDKATLQGRGVTVTTN